MITLLNNLAKLASGILQFINAILVLSDAMDKEDTKLQEADSAVQKLLETLGTLDYGDKA